MALGPKFACKSAVDYFTMRVLPTHFFMNSADLNALSRTKSTIFDLNQLSIKKINISNGIQMSGAELSVAAKPRTGLPSRAHPQDDVS